MSPDVLGDAAQGGGQLHIETNEALLTHEQTS
jgi:hypothetical protein